MLPVLYSFRRCPYAIRARYTIAYLNVPVNLREVVLKAKPEALLSLGGRSSVPQLVDMDGARYPESMDIILWALSKSNNRIKVNSVWPSDACQRNKMSAWIRYNDVFFKKWLDRYKYADRYTEFSESYYFAQCEVFLRRLNRRLGLRSYLMGEKLSVADISVFPFVRQFAAVNQKRFDESEYDNVKKWLSLFLDTALFNNVVMKKYPMWTSEQENVVFPAR